MSLVGNDNYRPGLAVPDPIKSSNGWLSSNMAQLMVFINGLILTITAFATLSIFIEEIVRDDLAQTIEQVEEKAIQNFELAENALFSLSYTIQIADGMSHEKLRRYLSQSPEKTKYFDQIWWVDDLEDSAQLNQQVYKKIDSFASNPREDAQVIDKMLDSFKGQKSDSRFMLTLDESLENIIDSKYFGVMYRAKNHENKDGLLIGITNFQNFIEMSWLEKKTSISYFNAIDKTSSESFFEFTAKDNSADLTRRTDETVHFFNFNFLGRDINCQINLIIQGRESFLRKIPFLMLLFGLTLTLIGTLYVRNNQRQSIKLSGMNKELAYKNYELSQEMSERERLNNMIQKSARENRAIINAVSDIIFELGVDGKIVFINETWKKVTGFATDQSIGRIFFDMLYSQDQEEQKRNFELLIKGQKQPYRAFTRLRTSNGTFRAVELTISMIRQDENKDLRIVGTITDVEERRRAEQALSEAEKKYRAIVENAAAGIYQVTPEGQYLSANPSMAFILGYKSPEDMLRNVQNVNNEIYVDDVKRERFLQSIVSSKTAGFEEIRIRKHDGSIIWVSENVRPVYDDDGTLLFFEGSMEDIDQRKKAELALKEEKVSSDLANRSKSEFLANMSHELRTPLNSIIGFSEIIKNQAFGDIAQKEYVEYSDNIFQSGNRLLQIINEILDVSRIEAGDRSLNEGHINISEIVSNTLMLLGTKIRQNKMQVHNKVIDTSLGLVGEAQAVKQMLINLVSNAVKFSPENAVMTIHSEIDSNGKLRLSITDTGVGLHEDEIEKALSPFGQLNTEHSRSKSGTGLGLTLVKSLMRLHGGELELVSQKGVGTTVTLVFPAERVTHNKKRQAQAEVQAADPSVKEEI